MKKILCFGDSNTFGFNPKNFQRYTIKERWSGILKTELSNYTIIEKGCNNRCGFNNNENSELCGYKSLKDELKNDIDVVILQIGINDTQIQYQTNEETIENGLKRLINIIKATNNKAEIIILCPSVINENILNSYFKILFNKESIKLSKKISGIYKKVCAETNCHCIDLNDISTISSIDGLHYDIENHQKIANYLMVYLKKILI